MHAKSKKDDKLDRIVEAIESGELDFSNGRVLSEEEANELFGTPDEPDRTTEGQTLRT
jgi:hypothetical protein